MVVMLCHYTCAVYITSITIVKMNHRIIRSSKMVYFCSFCENGSLVKEYDGRDAVPKSKRNRIIVTINNSKGADVSCELLREKSVLVFVLVCFDCLFILNLDYFVSTTTSY